MEIVVGQGGDEQADVRLDGGQVVDVHADFWLVCKRTGWR